MLSKEKIKIWRENPVKFVRDQFGVEPDVWQEKALNAFASNDREMIRISLQACAGPGKAQPNDILIHSWSNGKIEMGKLEVGDNIIGSRGQKTKVTHVHERGKRQVYMIHFSDGTCSEACAEHLWKVLDRKRDRIYNTLELVEKLNKNKRKYIKIPIQGKANFRGKKKLQINPYTLGCWLGDGGRNSGRITTGDSEIIEIIRNRGERVSKPYILSYTIYKLVSKLKKMGICDKYSYEKSIPIYYLEATIEDRIELLRGIMDTDGSIDSRDGHCEIALTSERLIEDISYLVRSLGGFAKRGKTRKTWYVDKEGNKKTCRDAYRISINTDFNPFNIKRKAKLWKLTCERYRSRYIVKIKKSRITKTRCITVSALDSLYLTNDFIVTHNSAVLAWCGWNFLSCYGEPGEHPKGAAVSVTWDNLKDNLWVEFAKWRNKSKYLQKAFTWTQTKIFANEHKETWFLSARSFPKGSDVETLGKTLSGIHSKYVLFLIDESGDIPIQIGKAAEQAVGETLARGGFVKLLQAGNPISLDGMLHDASKSDNWHTIRITGDPDDPDRSKRIDITWAREQIDKYGIDDPWVMAYILGRFPISTINTLLSVDEIEDAMNRHLTIDKYGHAQKRLGIDVARFGLDSTVIFPRQGLASFKYSEMRKADGPMIAARVVQAKKRWGSEMEFFDDTGGYGASAIDSMLTAGFSPIAINFASKAINEKEYFNRRAEMWFEMAKWVKRGAVLPKCARLKKELAAPTYSFKNGRIILESKEQIKKRLKFSPDVADALALTFAMPDMPATDEFEYLRKMHNTGNKTKSQYNPFSKERLRLS